MVYEWDLVRTTGTKTEKDKPMQTVNCPNCGAPVEINASAKCPYCGSVITLEEHDFALNAIRAISRKREDNAPRQTHSTKKLHRPGRAVEFFEI